MKRPQPYDINYSPTLIHSVSRNVDPLDSSRPVGFCVDIGAPRSVVGELELTRLLKHLGRRRGTLRNSKNSFRFADAVYESLGTIFIPLRTPRHVKAIPVELDVVTANVPALLGLDAMDGHCLTPCTVSNTLVKRVVKNGKPVDLWSVKLIRAHSQHLYAPLQLPNITNFTRVQLQKLHRQFFHPSPDKLFNLIKKARPEHATTETRAALEDITARCDPCQRIKQAPLRFRVSFGAEHVRFNERIIVDIMYIDGEPILHIVDEGTHFSAARFLPNVRSDTVWMTILSCWSSIYTGIPHRILVDQGSAFGEPFANLCRVGGVEVQRTGIEAHSSLNLGERYHEPLRTIYRKLMASHPRAEKHLTLAMCVKAMNDTLGPNGVVPSALVFGEHPQVFTRSETTPPRATLDERSKLAFEARQEMEQHMARVRTDRALRHAVPPAADQNFQQGDKVLVWREKIVNNRIGEWLGPFEVEGWDIEKKIVFVKDVRTGPSRPFNIAQVRKYLQPEIIAHTHVLEIAHSLRRLSHEATTEAPVSDVMLTEVLDPDDPRSRSMEMSKAIKKEVNGLMERGTFRILKRMNIPKDANVIPCKFVLAIKSDVDEKLTYKARFVAGGHRDRRKDFLVHSSQTVQPWSTRLLLSLSEMYDFELWVADVRQAYLQTEEPLGRDVFIRNVPPEFNLKPDEAIQLVKPLYGLSESGDLWHATLDRHHRKELRMHPLASDQALFTEHTDGTLSGLSALYVDDLLRAGTNAFRERCRATAKKFDTTEKDSVPFEFTGFNIERLQDGRLAVSQNRYLRKLEELPEDADFHAFRSMRMRLAWLANSRPDVLFEIATLAQVTLDNFKVEKRNFIKRLNRAIRYAITHRVPLIISKLDPKTVKVVGYSDASFANNHDLSTQLGYIILLVDGMDNSVPLVFKSYKSRRITRSAMAGEVIAFADMSDAAVTINKELSSILGHIVPLQLLTDSKCLFDVISKGSRTSEKRLMLDIAVAREQFRVSDVSDIGLVRSASNLADGLTKAMQQASLRACLGTGITHVTPVQSIIRTPRNDDTRAFCSLSC